MTKLKIYEYQWFKPYVVNIVDVGRRIFYKKTTKYMTKEEANSQGIYDYVLKSRRLKK